MDIVMDFLNHFYLWKQLNVYVNVNQMILYTILVDLLPRGEAVENIVQLMFVLHEIDRDELLESLDDQLELDQELLDTIHKTIPYQKTKIQTNFFRMISMTWISK
jgi:hypothetical protein